MSIFNSIFGEPKPNSNSSNINWIQLEDLGQINEIITLSEEMPVIIFKHSTRCSISRMALGIYPMKLPLDLMWCTNRLNYC
jgi:hypothetical protein